MSPPLVGRDPELEILGRCLSETHSGKGMAVLISGAPRIGKSSLLDELCVRAEARGFRVLRTRPTSRYLPGDDSAWPYVVHNLIPSRPQNVIDSQCPAEGAASTWVAASKNEAAPPLDKCVEFLLGLRRQDHACSHSLRYLFEMVSRERPLLLTVDDLDDTDEPLLALFQIASQGFRTVRALLVAAYSSPETSVRSLARATVESIGRHARRIELAELEPAATAKLVRQIAGNAFDEIAVRQVHNLTGGNPGLILDMVRTSLMHTEANSSIPAHVGVPSAIRVVIEERLGALSPEARGLLGIASAVGNTFAPQLLLSLVPPAIKDPLAALLESDSGLIRSVVETATTSSRALSKGSCTKNSHQRSGPLFIGKLPLRSKRGSPERRRRRR